MDSKGEIASGDDKAGMGQDGGQAAIVADIYTGNCSFVSVNCISFEELVSFNDSAARRTS